MLLGLFSYFLQQRDNYVYIFYIHYGEIIWTVGLSRFLSIVAVAVCPWWCKQVNLFIMYNGVSWILLIPFQKYGTRYLVHWNCQCFWQLPNMIEEMKFPSVNLVEGICIQIIGFSFRILCHCFFPDKCYNCIRLDFWVVLILVVFDVGC